MYLPSLHQGYGLSVRMAKGVPKAVLGPVQHILHFAQIFKAVVRLPDLQNQVCMLQNRIALLAHDPELFMLANSDAETGEHTGVTVHERGLGGGVAGHGHCTCLD